MKTGICVVCDAPAFGFHYGAQTCNSCKVFFGRNALLSSQKTHCLHGQDKCSVTHTIQRKCTKCRLKRCFSMGMRIDRFQNEIQKQTRKSSLSRLWIKLPSQWLSTKDRSFLDSINSSYLQHVSCDPSSFHYDPTDPSSVIHCWSEIRSQTALNFIEFFRQINEFVHLNQNDRFFLVKYNFFLLFCIYKCSNHNFSMDFHSDLPHGIQLIFRQWSVDYPEFQSIINSMSQLMHSFVKLTGKEMTLVKLIFIILFFSTSMLIHEDEVRLEDPLAIHRAQSNYANLIWNFLLEKQTEKQTVQQFSQLINLILNLQLIATRLKTFVRSCLINTGINHRINPLVQSTLNLP